jgi:hypothetical protein
MMMTRKRPSIGWRAHVLAEAAPRPRVDMVSKNGNLLLNVPFTLEGELEPDTVAMLPGSRRQVPEPIDEGSFFAEDRASSRQEGDP